MATKDSFRPLKPPPRRGGTYRVPMIDMLKATKMRWWSWMVWIASMVLVCLLSVSPIYIDMCHRRCRFHQLVQWTTDNRQWTTDNS